MEKKKLICMLLAFVLMLPMMFGCKTADTEPLRICIDLEYTMETKFWVGGMENSFFNDELKQTLSGRLLTACKEKNAEYPENIALEYIPADGQERENTLKRIRTEVMSGEGPDIFLIGCSPKSIYSEALFTIPEKAMELSLFMTLDEYMENNTVFSEWDKMNQAVLAGGRTAEGQQIIPLMYTVPVSVYRASETEHTQSKELTWQDMLESEDSVLSSAAVWTDNLFGEIKQGDPFMTTRCPMTEFTLGKIADFKNEELLFSEDELRQRLKEIMELGEAYTAGTFDLAPAHYNAYLGHEFNAPMFGRYEKGVDGKPLDAANGIKYNEEFTMVPIYSDDGGVNAEICLYMAVNRNTRRPDDAFRLVDYFSSFDVQRCDRLYTTLYDELGIMSENLLPMYSALLTEETRIYNWSPDADQSMIGWSLPAHNVEEVQSVLDQITHVRFRSLIDNEFDKLYYDYLYAEKEGKNRDALITEFYRNLQRMLRE